MRPSARPVTRLNPALVMLALACIQCGGCLTREVWAERDVEPMTSSKAVPDGHEVATDATSSVPPCLRHLPIIVGKVLITPVAVAGDIIIGVTAPLWLPVALDGML
jgi:hypothetical protein